MKKEVTAKTKKLRELRSHLARLIFGQGAQVEVNSVIRKIADIESQVHKK